MADSQQFSDSQPSYAPADPLPWTIRRVSPDDRHGNGQRIGWPDNRGWVAIDSRDGGRFFRLTRRGAEKAVREYEAARRLAAETEYEFDPRSI